MKTLSAIAFFLVLPFAASAQTDSLDVHSMDEVVVVSTPKEHDMLKRQPVSSSILTSGSLLQRHIEGIKDLTANVPGLFIPNYGSHLTTSIYLRGLGSRMGTPAVGLYIDGIAMADMSSLDQDISDADRIDVLRGPQGTLYGSNTLGGLIRVFTKNPFRYQGTDIRLGYASYNDYRASVTHYHRPSEKVAFSGGISYRRKGGFFHNTALGGQKADAGDNMALRWRGIYRPSDSVSLDLSARYQWTDEGGYPYVACAGSDAGVVAANRPSGYRRHLLDAGLHAEHRFRHLDLTSSTGFQFLSDNMCMDQDFSRQDIYTLEQAQRSKSISQEFALKNKAGGRWQWATGADIRYQALHTDGPVTFHQEGLDWLSRLTTDNINRHMPVVSAGPMTMTFLAGERLQAAPDSPNREEVRFGTQFTTPGLTTGLFHQSTLTSLFGIEGLSATVGLRLDYERSWMSYDAAYAMQHTYSLSGKLTGMADRTISMIPATTFPISSELQGNLHQHHFHLMPHVSLQHRWSADARVYATVSRGYRRGGYNVQMFNELLQTDMRNTIQRDIARTTLPVMQAQPTIPADTKQQVETILSDMAQGTPMNVAEAVSYKPETAWNYEAGTGFSFWNGKVNADLAAYWIEASGLQLSQMSATGMGRITVNSGSSRNIGAEVSLTAHLTGQMSLHGSYSYNRSVLLHTGTEAHPDDYRVPFSPAHTMSFGAHRQWTTGGWAERISLSANVKGCGRTYWDRENTFSQGFYALLDARLAVGHGGMEYAVWACNLTQTRYHAFGFITRSQQFAQKGTPCQVGVDVRVKL